MHLLMFSLTDATGTPFLPRIVQYQVPVSADDLFRVLKPQRSSSAFLGGIEGH